MTTDSFDRLAKLVWKLDKWRLCMSYNESYFGEPEGMLKETIGEMSRIAAESFSSPDLAEACKALLDSSPKNMTHRNAKERDAYRAIRAALRPPANG